MPDIPFPINIDLLHPSFAALQLSSIVFPCQGDGILPGDQAPVFPSEFGLWWEFTAVPPSLGFEVGPTAKYHNRMVQWRLVHTLNGVDLVTDVVDANYERWVWMWPVSKPSRIEFSVLPGVALNARKIVALAPPS